MSKLREARKNAKITQADLAKELGINRATISKYESGEIEPQISQLKLIARILDVNWIDLVPDAKQGDAVVADLTKRLSENRLPLRKASEAEMHRAGLLQFKCENDRIAFFYSRLNIDGKLAANLCFYKHLNVDALKEVADYVESLSEVPQYQQPAEPQDEQK